MTDTGLFLAVKRYIESRNKLYIAMNDKDRCMETIELNDDVNYCYAGMLFAIDRIEDQS